MKKPVLALVVFLLSTITVLSGMKAQADDAGLYSEEQATRGQALYYQHCLVCHGETMSGQDQAPALAGPQFATNWEGETLRALTERIATMPPDKPGKLSLSENVDILGYILWFNGLPMGTEPLAAERKVLEGLHFQVPAHGQ